MPPLTCSPPCAALDESLGDPGKARRFPGNATARRSGRAVAAGRPRGSRRAGACRTLWPPVGRAPCRRRGRRPRWRCPDPARCGGLRSVQRLVRGGCVRLDGRRWPRRPWSWPGRVFGHLERRCVLAAGAGDFSLALGRRVPRRRRRALPGARRWELRGGRPRARRARGRSPAALGAARRCRYRLGGKRCGRRLARSAPHEGRRPPAPGPADAARRRQRGMARLSIIASPPSMASSSTPSPIWPPSPATPLGRAWAPTTPASSFLPMQFALSPCRWVKARVLISRGVLPT